MKRKVKITETQSKLLEAMKTACQTPDTIFHTEIKDKMVTCKIELPMALDLSDDESKILETNIHNAMELVFTQYFKK